jgi:hypothetical protein
LLTVVLVDYCLSITLEEWLKLNFESISEEDQVDEETIRIFTIHCAWT